MGFDAGQRAQCLQQAHAVDGAAGPGNADDDALARFRHGRWPAGLLRQGMGVQVGLDVRQHGSGLFRVKVLVIALFHAVFVQLVVAGGGDGVALQAVAHAFELAAIQREDGAARGWPASPAWARRPRHWR